MRTPPGVAAISKQQIADGVGYKVYTPPAAAVQVSRPSTLRSIPEASAATALWLFDTKVWLKSPPGQPMPLLGEYGLNMAQPSSDEMLDRFGGGS
jgi:hypothetical protein